MFDADQVVDLYQQRLKDPGGQHARMQEIRSIYAGLAAVDLPDINGIKTPPVPNLVATGIDQIAGRIASVIPSVGFVPKQKAQRREQRRATTAARVVQAWWEADGIPLKMHRRARHLVAYAYSPVVVGWDFKEHRPTWQIRDPLTCWPDSNSLEGDPATDVVFSYRRSAAWLEENGYGWAIPKVTDRSREIHRGTPMQLLEYVGEYGTCLVLVGDSRNDVPVYAETPQRAVLLEEVELPCMSAFIPSRVSLDSPMGQFDTMIGMYHTQARLAALEVIAVEKGIFPDTYLVSRAGELGKFIDGPFDGRTGQVNVVAGGDVKEMNPQPGYLTNPTIDRLERNQRVTAGIPPEFGAESSTGIRTGRRGDSVLSAAIDHPIAEAQQVFASSLEKENEAAIQLAKYFDGDRERTFYVGTGNAASAVTFVADSVFKEDSGHLVSYPAVGSDMNSLIIGLGQRVGLGIMSKKTAAELDPFISDAESEHDQIIGESLEAALLAGIQQQAAGGQIPPAVLARLIDFVGSDKMELAEAMNKIVEEAAAEQAAQQQQQGMNPQAMTAEQMMAQQAPQALAGAQQSTIPGANESQKDLNTMLLALRGPAMGVRPNLQAGRV